MAETVLVIEDETQTRNLFLNALEFEGFTALGTGSGAEGIELAKRYRPNLIVCDVMMPDLDGYAVLATLRKFYATVSIPFIFLTAKVTMADLRRGMDQGADDYLTKPCTIEQFLGAIAARLKRQHELHQTQSQALTQRQLVDSEPLKPEHEPVASGTTIFPDCPKLQHVFQFIEGNYHRSITLRDVAQVAGYSPAYLTNLVQSQTGRTIKQWIIERRMAQARCLLQETTTAIKQIAQATGYTDAGYFIRQFRQVNGLSPQAWRDHVNA